MGLRDQAGGYRAEAIRTADGITFYSRNGKSLGGKFPYIVEALSARFSQDLSHLDESARKRLETLNGVHSNAAGIRRWIENSKAASDLMVKAFGSKPFAYWRKHLRTMKGQWAPIQSLLDLANDEQAIANDDRVTDIILLGRAKMPAFQQKLTQQQFDDLMAYLHTL